MNNRFSDDRDLARSFEALRNADRRGTPAFRSLLRRPRRADGPVSPTRLTGALAAGGLALAAAIAGAALLLPQHTVVRPLDDAIAQATEMSSWSAPTDTFLEVDSLDSRSDLPADRP